MNTRKERKEDREDKRNPRVLIIDKELWVTDAEVRIIEVIYSAMEQGKRPSDIVEDTGFSEPTVHKYLKELVNKKVITREVMKSVKYPPPVIYKLAIIEKDDITLEESANNYRINCFAENCYKWVHSVRYDFNEVQYARQIIRVALSKLQMKNIDEIKGNNTYELAEEFRQYISHTLKSRDPALLREEDKEFIKMADLIKQGKVVIEFFTTGVYPKSKSRKKGKMISSSLLLQ